MVVELYPEQQVAVDKLSNGKILYGLPGSGKSITAMMYFFTKVCKGVPGDFGSLRTPMDIYVITTARKRDDLDWEEEAIKFGISTHRESSVASIQLVVDSWNNIKNYEDVKDAFFIFDEQRVVGSGAWSQAFIKIAKRNQWIILSGTPGDTWLDYIPVFVANGWYKNRTAFKNEHVVYSHYGKFPKVDRYLGAGKLVRLRNQVLVPMPVARHTIWHRQDVYVDHDKDLLEKVEKKRWHVYEMRPLKDVAEMFSVMRKVVNSNASRVETVQKLLEKHPRLIVFYNFDYELEQLRTLGATPATPSHTPAPVTHGTTDPVTSASLSDAATTPGSTTKGSTNAQQPTQLTQPTKENPWTSSGTANNSASTSPVRTTHVTSSPSQTRTESTTSDPKTTSGYHRSGLASRSREGRIPTRGYSPGKTSSVSKTSSTSAARVSSSSTTGATPSGSSAGKWTEDNGNGEMWIPSPTSERSQNRKSSSSGTASSSMSPGSTIAPAKSESDSAGTSEPVLIAEWNGHKHEKVPTTDRWLYLVQYMAGSEAWNCTTTDAVCFYSMNYSYKLYEQAHGRIDRLNTPFTHLYSYTLMSRSFIDKAIRKALGSKKNFNERDLGFKM